MLGAGFTRLQALFLRANSWGKRPKRGVAAAEWALGWDRERREVASSLRKVATAVRTLSRTSGVKADCRGGEDEKGDAV